MAHRPSTGARRGVTASRRPPTPATTRLLAATAVALAVATVAGLALLWPREEGRQDLRSLGLGFGADLVEARVASVEEAPCTGTTAEERILCLHLSFDLQEGPDRGQIVTLELPSTVSTPDLQPGEGVVLARDPQAQEGFEYRYADRQREASLLWLAVLFGVAVVALGRLRGVAALAGLGATFVVVLQFVLPGVLQGQNPLLVAVVGSAAIAYLALYLAHGFSSMTTVALLGTLAALALTALLATTFVELARISGFATEEATIVRIGAAQVDLAGLVLGGVVIGALGAIDDMTVTQASAVWELRAVNPAMSRRSLVVSGLRIGRDHVASTVNTLVLAYAGASMPLLLLFILSRQSLLSVANSEVVATEIVRTLVGSIGLVASVPITTWLAARAVPPPSPVLPLEPAGADEP